ncbi:MAG: acetyl-CoA carboxylase biotin carboxyl carrier protein [Alphaproteobacteria bacterium]|nr:acetyl-CoA carboxylase biotin carboxyl carrier protein [Alphaproteobacteria bacterium]
MELTEDDVLEILKLFEQSKFDFLQLQQGERKITVSKGGYVPAGAGGAPVSPQTPVIAQAPAVAPQSASKPQAAAVDAGLVPVTAPMVGKFYAAASPSDPPYVQPGTRVEVGATVCLLEVMKVFASVKAETAGVIEKILVTNGEFVEFGQPLFLLRPDGPA